MKAMILAAGLGTRMRPLTDHTPKPMLRVAGKPLIEHHVNRLVTAGFVDILINHAYLGEQIENYLGDGKQFGARIQYSREGTPLDSGGGIFRALPLLGDEPFLALNADVWTDYPLQQLLSLRAAIDGKNRLAHLVLTDNPPQHPHGDFYLSSDSRLHAESDNKKLTWTGIRVMHPTLFDGCSDGIFSIVPLLKKAMTMGLVSGEYFSGLWIDVGTPERLSEVNRLAGGGI
jgi:MurNAc alpha-1-phosphate uridylyltransferase